MTWMLPLYLGWGTEYLVSEIMNELVRSHSSGGVTVQRPGSQPLNMRELLNKRQFRPMPSHARGGHYYS